MSCGEVWVAAGAVAVGALAQSWSGIGFVLVCGPFLAAAVGAREAVRLAALLSLVVNLVLLARSPRAVDGGSLRVLVPVGLVGTPLAAWAASGVPPRTALALAGGTTLLGTLLVASGLRWRRARGTAGAVAAAVLSALMAVTAGIGGPAVALYAENAGWPRQRGRTTLQAYFLVLNVATLASLGLPRLGSPVAAAAAGGLALGLLAGRWSGERVSEGVARRSTLGLSAVGGVLVLARALL